MAHPIRLWAAAAIALTLAAAPGSEPSPRHADSPATDRVTSTPRAFGEHRYRIVGKIRLALFWIGRDDVGGARMTWRSTAGSTTLALLAGSDPDRAPRKLNQWAYLREETRAEGAEVFALRTLTDEQAAPDTWFELGQGPQFGVSCASMDSQHVNSAVTSVKGRDLTYRMFDRVLEQIGASPAWKERATERPAGTEPGFLTALQRVMQPDPARPASMATAYVYNGGVYDLRVRRRRAQGPTRVAGRTFAQLTRADLTIRNRATGDETPFGVTYAPDASGLVLPVQIFYQPSFWVSIELRLDDAADVPADPAENGAVLNRIHRLCGTAGAVDSDRR